MPIKIFCEKLFLKLLIHCCFWNTVTLCSAVSRADMKNVDPCIGFITSGLQQLFIPASANCLWIAYTWSKTLLPHWEQVLQKISRDTNFNCSPVLFCFFWSHKGHSQAPAYHKNVIVNRWHIGWPLSDFGCYQWFVSSMQRRKLANDLLMITSLFHELFLFTFFLNTANIGEVVFLFIYICFIYTLQK